MSTSEVKKYLSYFDNDALAAKAAIDSYIATNTPIKRLNTKDRDTLIKVTDLEKSYRVNRQLVPALKGINLEIQKGEFVAITGPSGSGKSTLLQLMGGLDKPSRGSIIIDGIDLKILSDHKLAHFRGQTIGFVFQFFYLQPFLTVKRNVEVPSMFAGLPRHSRHEDIDKIIKAVGLEDRIKHYPKELSGGQIQRAAIARALMNHPKVILADEPTGNLDNANSKAIIDLFDNIRIDFGTTIVVVTHDLSIASHADRQIRLLDGKVL